MMLENTPISYKGMSISNVYNFAYKQDYLIVYKQSSHICIRTTLTNLSDIHLEARSEEALCFYLFCFRQIPIHLN